MAPTPEAGDIYASNLIAAGAIPTTTSDFDDHSRGTP